MRDIPLSTFLIIIDAFVIALFITMLSGCVTTPTKYRDRTGDFVSNIASTAGTSSMAPPTTSRARIAGARPASVS